MSLTAGINPTEEALAKFNECLINFIKSYFYKNIKINKVSS